MNVAAWVNWNPEPLVHAYGTNMPGGRVLALCRVMVREERGVFDPNADDACPVCADDVAHGRAWEQVKARRAAALGPNTIVCRR